MFAESCVCTDGHTSEQEYHDNNNSPPQLNLALSAEVSMLTLPRHRPGVVVNILIVVWLHFSRADLPINAAQLRLTRAESARWIFFCSRVACGTSICIPRDAAIVPPKPTQEPQIPTALPPPDAQNDTTTT